MAKTPWSKPLELFKNNKTKEKEQNKWMVIKS
jgi:hypothetical protein